MEKLITLVKEYTINVISEICDTILQDDKELVQKVHKLYENSFSNEKDIEENIKDICYLLQHENDDFFKSPIHLLNEIQIRDIELDAH